MRLCLLLLCLTPLAACTSFNVTERTLIAAERTEADRTSAADSLAAPFSGVAYEEQRIQTADGTTLYGALLRQPDADLTVLYFGGNAYTVGDYGAGTARELLPFGTNVFLVDHRGYGWSDGEPTAASLLSDALVVFDHVASLPGVGVVVVHGQSLGSFLAGHVGANRSAAGVVLESSATTPKEWAGALVPTLYKPFVRVRIAEPLQAIDNRAAVERIEESLLIVVGAEDEATSPGLSRRLYDASPLPEDRKALVVIEGAGHNDVMTHAAFVEAYRTFLGQVRSGR